MTSHKSSSSKRQYFDSQLEGDSSPPSKRRQSDVQSKSAESQDEEEHPLIKLWFALYKPETGNYYHWALAISNAPGTAWHTLDVFQEVADGPYHTRERHENPRDCDRCRQPLILLAELEEGSRSALVDLVRAQSVGTSLSWNCQDYVVEIWESVQGNGLVSSETFEAGSKAMLRFYGPDFGQDDEQEDNDDDDDGGNDEDENDDDQEEDEDRQRHYTSAEHIEDSDE